MITDAYIEKDGKKILKVTLLFIDSEDRLCDGCDEEKKCASISAIDGTVTVICKGCLQEIINQFN
jgi:hypothetical protein